MTMCTSRASRQSVVFRRGIGNSVALLVAATVLAGAARAELPAEVTDGLATSKYVYISSTRKDGSLSKPAEIWFLYHQGAIYVGTPPTSWRVRRIKAGRPHAKIWVGKPDGPSFVARGAVVKDAALEQLMLDTFAKKYPDAWPRYADKFRDGFKDGTRVLVKYVP